MRQLRRESPRNHQPADGGRHRARLAMIALGCWLAAGVAAAEPFGPTDPDAVYSNQARIHYRITRSCLADLATCLSEPGLTSPCGLSDSITGDDCYSGVHRFCAAKGHLSGFGVEDPADPSTVDVTCVGAGAAALVDVTFGELQAMHSPCTDANSSAACGVATDRWCRSNQAWTLGFGPVERNIVSGPPTKSQFPVDTAKIACVETDVSQTFVAPLVPCLVGGSKSPVSSACRQAMDDHCQQQTDDLRGGIGFRERGVNVDFGCIERHEPWQPNSVLPPAPALPVDVNEKTWNDSAATPGGLVHNALAPNRSISFDGRIKVTFRENIGGINYMSFRVQTPEIFDAPLTQVQGPGRNRSFELYSWAAFYGFDVPEHDASGDGIFHGSSGGAWEAKSTAICDPHQGSGDPIAENRQQSVPGRVSNPFACNSTGGTFGSGLDHDCYDLTIVSIYDNGPADEIWGAPVRVVVTNPKGAGINTQSSLDTRAHVVHVEILGPPQQATFPPGNPTNIFEPNISGDGRLIMINGPTGEISYAVMPERATPCDVTQWSAFKQLHQMHADPDMADYGIARYPIRDHEGELLGTRKVIGAYPWLDRDGDTLMWMAASAPLYYVDSQGVAHEKFEIVSHPHDCDGPTPPSFNCDLVYLHPTNMTEVQASTDSGNRLGMSVLGLWTHGKMVSPDSRNNAADFGLKNSKYQWRNVRLYSDVPEGTLVNGGTIRFSINSSENQFFLHQKLQPDIPREVAWFVSTEKQTDEVAFDDSLDPMALVVSPMNPSIQPEPPGNRGRFQDGFVYTGNFQGEGFQYPAHIANAATSVSEEVVQTASQPGVDYSDNLQWNIPPYGYLLGGARAEPIAAGGTKGRGLWLDGTDDRLEYLVPEQPAERVAEMASVEWLYTVAIEPRELTFRRRLLTLPDGSWLDVIGSRFLELGSGPNPWPQLITIPVELELTPGRWSTVAVVSTAAPSLDIYLDGYLLASQTPNGSAFRMQQGRITLGAQFTGFAGWVDDFKVIAGVDSSQVDAPEVICNHARGTLVGLVPTDPLWARAGVYPATSHQAIAARLPASQQFARYACERPIDDPIDGIDLADHAHYMCLGQTRRMDATSNPECVRSSLLFPEGPLFFDLPRPDSLTNSFCLSCHRDSHPSATMQATEALMPGIIAMHQDIRRQPMQNSPKICGFIPAGLIDGEPATDVVTPVDCTFLDQYTTPSSDDP